MKNNRLLFSAGILTLVCTVTALNTAQGDWAHFRAFFQSLRDTNTMVENTVTFIKAYNPQPGDRIHVTTGLGNADYNEMAISMSKKTSGTYGYLLEVWTKRNAWMKAMEFSFNDSTSGQFVWEPHALVETYFAGTMDRLVYSTSGSERTMAWEVSFSPDKPHLEQMKAQVFRANDTVSVFMTIHLDTNYVGTATNDAYLIGAKIEEADPNRATLLCGMADRGSDYSSNGFTYSGTTNADNAGLFSKDGFVTDAATTGSHNGSTYPAPDGIIATNLPTATEVDAVSISFENAVDTPDFVE